MAYAEATDVQEEFKSIKFDAPNAIKTTQVERFIEEADSYINVRLSQVYVTPITATACLPLMRSISIALVATRIKRILEVKTADDSKQDVRPLSGMIDPEKTIDKIVKKEISLPGAALISGDAGIKSYNVDHGEEHTFLKGTDQW